MDLSVIIASTRIDMTRACLKGFEQQVGNAHFEVIVAGNVDGLEDNCSSNVVLIKLNEIHPNVKRNRAIANAKSDCIALMDDDAIPDTHWVETAIEFSKRNKDAVATGPELCYPNVGVFAKISHKVLSSTLSEFTKGHVNSISEQVNWYDVPFCNCVFSKKMWQLQGGFSEQIPWHMDDFHFFFPYRNKAIFHNVPQLKIAHNRYPETLKGLIKYKWRLRTETGEKLIWTSEMYWAVPPVRNAVLGSLFLVLLFVVLFKLYFPITIFLVALYFLFALMLSLFVVRAKSISEVFNGFIVLIAVQLTSVFALYYGMFSAVILTVIGKRKY